MANGDHCTVFHVFEACEESILWISQFGSRYVVNAISWGNGLDFRTQNPFDLRSQRGLLRMLKSSPFDKEFRAHFYNSQVLILILDDWIKRFNNVFGAGVPF